MRGVRKEPIRPNDSVFRWDAKKARSNVLKDDVTFIEAATVFPDSISVTVGDPLHSTEESRFVTIGRSKRGRTLVVVHSEFGDAIRIISARLATRRERRDYEESAGFAQRKSLTNRQRQMPPLDFFTASIHHV